MKNNKILLFFLLLFFQTSIAQIGSNYPVGISAYVKAPYSQQWSEFFTNTDYLKTNLVLKDKDRPFLDVFLRIKIERAGIVIRSREDFIPSRSIRLNFGSPLALSGVDLAEYFQADNIVAEGIDPDFFRTGGSLPDGLYTISLTAFEYDGTRGYRQVSNSSFSLMTIFWAYPPQITYPIDGQVIADTYTPNIMFRWLQRSTALQGGIGGLLYKFELFEVLAVDQNIDDVVQVPGRIPIYEETTNTPYLLYDGTKPALLSGRKYTIRVTVSDLSGNTSFYNEGISQIVSFKYGTPCEVPTDLVLTKANESQYFLDWASVPDAEGYQVQYSLASNNDWQNFETSFSSTLIDMLDGEMKFRVKTLCSVARESTFSEEITSSGNVGKSAKLAAVATTSTTTLPPTETEAERALRKALNPYDENVSSDDINPTTIEGELATIRPIKGTDPTPCGAAIQSTTSCETTATPYGGTEPFAMAPRKNIYINGYEILVTSGNANTGEGLLYYPYVATRIPVGWSGLTVVKGPTGTDYGCIVNGEVVAQGSEDGVLTADLTRQITSLLASSESFAGKFGDAMDKMGITAAAIKAKLGNPSTIDPKEWTNLGAYTNASKKGVEDWANNLKKVFGNDLSAGLSPALAARLAAIQTALSQGITCAAAKNCSITQLQALEAVKAEFEALKKEIQKIIDELLVEELPTLDAPIGASPSTATVPLKSGRVAASDGAMASASVGSTFTLKNGGKLKFNAGVTVITNAAGKWVINGIEVGFLGSKLTGDFIGLYKTSYYTNPPPNPCTKSSKIEVGTSKYPECAEGYLNPADFYEVLFDKIITVAPNIASSDLTALTRLYSGADGGIKAKVFISNDSSPPEFIAKVAAYEVPDGFAKIWLHQIDGVWILQEGSGGDLSKGEAEILAFDESLGKISSCNITIANRDAKGLVGVLGTAQYGIDKILSGLHSVFSWAAKGIDGKKIPDKYWNCNNSEYVDYGATAFEYVLGPLLRPIVDKINIKLKSLFLEAKGTTSAEAMLFATTAGLWNGMIGTFSGAAEAIGKFANAGTCTGQDNFWATIEEVANYRNPQNCLTSDPNCSSSYMGYISDKAAEAARGLRNSPCLIAEIGGEVGFAVGAAIVTAGLSSAASLTKLGQITQVFFKGLNYADKVTEVFDVGGKIFSLGAKIAGKSVKFAYNGGKAFFRKIDLDFSKLTKTKSGVAGTDGNSYEVYSETDLPNDATVKPLLDEDGNLVIDDDGGEFGIGCAYSPTATGQLNLKPSSLETEPVFYASLNNYPAFEAATNTGGCPSGQTECALKKVAALDWLGYVKAYLKAKGISEVNGDFYKDFNDNTLKRFAPFNDPKCKDCLGDLDPEAWKVLNDAERPSLRKNIKVLESLTVLLKNPKAIAIFGNAVIMEDAIKKLSQTFDKTWPNKLDFDIALTQLNASINKFQGKAGFAESVIKSVTNGGVGEQDGFWFMLKSMDNLDPNDVKTIDLSFKKDVDDNFTPCKGGANAERCFDIELTGKTLKFIEYKSIQYFKNPTTGKLSFNIGQFQTYLKNIDNLSELSYIFNKSKIADPKKFMKYIFEENAEAIWNAGLTKNLFSKLKLKNGTVVDDKLLFREYLSEIDSSNSLFDFVN